MLFKKKIDRMTDAIREQQAADAKRYRDALPDWEQSNDDEPMHLTKRDVLAIVLSAFVAFGPILLILLGAIWLLVASLN